MYTLSVSHLQPLATSRVPVLSDPRAPTLAPLSEHIPQPWLGRWGQPPHACSREEVQDRLAAALIGKEVPDHKPVIASACLSSHLCLQDFQLAFPEWAVLEDMLTRLDLVRALPALGGGLLLRPQTETASRDESCPSPGSLRALARETVFSPFP